MKKHWTHFLPEKGKAIEAIGHKIVDAENEIKILHEQINSLRVMASSLENNALFMAKSYYSDDEIDQAKRLIFMKEQDTKQEPNFL